VQSKVDNQKLWDSYHELLLGPDIGRIRKLLIRYDLYKKTKDVAGDIFECGVFKGAGFMYWLKILAVYEPQSLKKVVGFDIFSLFGGPMTEKEKKSAEVYLKESGVRDISPDKIYAYAKACGLRERVELIAGDIAKTAKKYVKERPDLQISLLHLDLDVYDATKAALEVFYPQVSKGGVIILDEYGDADWDETSAVDEYFKDKNIVIEKIPFSSKPSSFIIKP